MNYKVVIKVLGWVFLLEAALMLMPLGVTLIYGESPLPFLYTILILVVVFGVCCLARPEKNKAMYARDGFVIVALTWIFMSLFGALPFVFSGEIPNYADAIFETVSGLTTTGASIIEDVEACSKGILFWRSFTHWIGGMGVLVFVLAIVPMAKTHGVHLMRAEVPGPTKSKLLPKLQNTAMVLYAIYVVLTLVEVVFLVAGGMPLFDSFLHAFGTAGTGGFGIKADSVAYYNSPYIENVIAVFLILFGTNFSLYYLILIGHIKQALKNEELRVYLCLIAFAVITIALNIMSITESFGVALQQAFFQVCSILTTAGFSTVDFNLWPTYSKIILVVLMFVGGCAGSTGGGMKVIRTMIGFKTLKREARKMVHPKAVNLIKVSRETVEETVVHNTLIFILAYAFIMFVSIILISLEGHDFETTVTSVIACIGNIGPGLGDVGPMGNYAFLTEGSKILLSLNMLLGRLEIFPILVLFMPSTWKGSGRKAVNTLG